jgi:hypothetical protein
VVQTQDAVKSQVNLLAALGLLDQTNVAVGPPASKHAK